MEFILPTDLIRFQTREVRVKTKGSFNEKDLCVEG